jgi:hypothetical protein
MALALQDYHDWLFRERDPHRENLVVCIHPWETGMDNSPAFIPLLKTVHAFLAGASKFLPPLDFRRADTVHVKAQERPTGQDYAAFVGLLSLFRFHQYNFDAVLGTTPFLIQDVLFNSTLCASVRALARLQEELAQNSSAETRVLLREQSRRNKARASEVAAAIRTKLWDPTSGYFFAFDLRGGALLGTPTAASFAPLMGGIASEEQSARLIDHLLDADGFGGCLPIPSIAPRHPLFDPVRYWSGPVWPITNRLIWQGLRERQSELAERVRSSTLQMIAEGVPLEEVADLAMQVMEANSAGRGGEEYTTPSMRQYHHAWLWDSAIAAVGWLYVSKKPKGTASDGLRPGFWEYYHPVTGAPLGSAHMTWTAAIFLDLFFANA